MYPHFFRAGLLVVLATLLIACSGGAEKEKNDGFSISGFVGDGSLVGATVTVTDANGDTVAEALSAQTTQYEVEIPPETPMPLTITATGGTDLVTAGEHEFDLVAVAFSTSRTVNVSPLTTLATRIADCSGSISESSINRSWSLIADKLSMGLTASVNPMNQPLAAGNAAQLVLANEALREALRRVRLALAAGGADASEDELLTRIACDLAEDALLNGVGSGADARTTATFLGAQAAVLLEVIAGGLYIGAQDASTFLDLAIEAVLGSSGVSVGDFVINDGLIDQARAALAIFLEQFPDDEILSLVLLLGGSDAAGVASDVAGALDAAHLTVLWGLTDRVALADSSEITDLQSRMNQQATASAPSISISASESTVSNSESVTLSWASGNADRCFASDGWTGEVSLTGSFTTGGLTRTTDFVLDCVGLGGTSVASAQVAVTNPDPAPVTTLNVQDPTIDSGGSTILSWSSTNADQCQASGAWSGSKGTTGSQSTGALNSTRTYTLTCSGSGGSDTASLTVSVVGAPPPPPAPTVSLSAAPQQIDSGDSTTLNWSSSNAGSCSASGGWSGARGTSGNEQVGPLNANTTFTLTCSGAGGNAVAMLAVNVNGTLSLSWVAPTENVDGSALNDLASYRIYYGQNSRSYSPPVAVNDANATTFAVTLPSGSYYVAMTALDADGNESAYSNEVLKATN